MPTHTGQIQGNSVRIKNLNISEKKLHWVKITLPSSMAVWPDMCCSLPCCRSWWLTSTAPVTSFATVAGPFCEYWLLSLSESKNKSLSFVEVASSLSSVESKRWSMLLSPFGASASSSIRCSSESLLYVFHLGIYQEENEVPWKGNVCRYKLKAWKYRESRTNTLKL